MQLTIRCASPAVSALVLILTSTPPAHARVGRDADAVVWSGDPFELSTTVEHLSSAGRRSRDGRLAKIVKTIDGGPTRTPIGFTAFNTVAFAGSLGAGWAAGVEGRIARLRGD